MMPSIYLLAAVAPDTSGSETPTSGSGQPADDTSTAVTDPSVFPWQLTTAMMAVVAGAALFAGLIVIRGRTKATHQDPKASVVRSWIAITLVISLVVFCAASFGILDLSLRSTLIGGFTASVGGAIAYYFSSKSADQARQDMLNAFVGTESVPKLVDKTVEEAKNTLGGTTLKLVVSNLNAPHTDDAKIVKQDPPQDDIALKGSSVIVTLTEHPANPLPNQPNGPPAAAPAPTVTSVDPKSGAVAGKQSIVIAGSNLLGATEVNFGAKPAQIQQKTDTEITVTSPQAAAAGVVAVTVTTPSGTSAAHGPDTDFTYEP